MQTRSLLTHSTWQEKKTRLRRRNAKRVEARGWVGGRRTAAGPRARGGNAAGTYLCGTRARYPDTGRAHEAMDATTSRGLTNLTRRLFFLRVQKALFPPVSIPTPARKPAKIPDTEFSRPGESARPGECTDIFESSPRTRKTPFLSWHPSRHPVRTSDTDRAARLGSFASDRHAAPIERAVTSRGATHARGTRAREAPTPADSEAVAERDARLQVRFCPPFCRRDRHGEPRNDAASWRVESDSSA